MNTDPIIQDQLNEFTVSAQENRQFYYDSHRNPLERKAELRQQGIVVEGKKINLADFMKWREKFPELDNYYRAEDDVWIEKLLEHYITFTFLNVKKEEVFIDVAASTSPWADILFSRGIESYRLDIQYKKGIHGRNIGANAADTQLPDGFADVLALHCAFECFTENIDTLFVQEAERILKKQGRLGIVPLYLDPIHFILTSPYCDQRQVIIDEGAKRIWREDIYHEPFSRHYSAEALANRIVSRLTGIKTKVYHFVNVDEIGAHFPGQRIYCYFMFVGEKE